MSDSEAPLLTGYEFDGFALSLATRELRHDGNLIEIQPKVYDLLVYLLQHRERAVDKQELQDKIWPRQVITEAALTRCVMKARKALGDDADRQRYIRTVHGMGYHLNAQVREFRAPPRESATAKAGTSNQRRHSDAINRRPALWLSIAPILIGISIALIWLWQREAQDSATSADYRNVAILPVFNATEDARYDWVRLGLMSTLGQVLETGSDTSVIGSRRAVEIAEKLGAENPDDESLRELAAQLADSESIGLIVLPVLEQIPGNLRIRYRIARANGRISERSVVGATVTSVAQATGADLRVFLGLQLDPDPVTTNQFGEEAYIKGRALAMQGEIQAANDMFKIASEQQPTAFWPRYEYAITLRDLGQRNEAEALLRQLVDEAAGGTDSSAHSASVNALAILLWRRGELDEASSLLEVGLEIVIRDEDAITEAILHTNLCILERIRGNLAGAREHGLKALEVYARQGVARPPGNVYHSLAQVALEENDFANAESNLRLGIETFRATGKRGNTATGLNSLASLQRLQGLYEEARSSAAEGLELRLQLADRVGESASRRELAQIEFERGSLTAAREQAENCLVIADELDIAHDRAYAQRLLAEIDLYQDEYDRASERLNAALAYYRERNQQSEAVAVRLLQVQLIQRQGQAEQAQSRLAELSVETADDAELRSLALAAGAELASATDQHERAAAKFGEALRYASETASQRQLARYRLGAAKAQFALNQLDLAAAELNSASVLSKDPDWLRLAARIAQARGKPVEATELANEAREAAGERWTEDDTRWLTALTAADP